MSSSKDIEILKGDYDSVYNQIITIYRNNDNSLIDILATARTSDLTIEESFELYKELRALLDGMIVLEVEDSKR